MKKYWKLAVLLVLAVAAVLVWRGVGSSKDAKPAADKTSAETGRRLRRGGRKQTFASPAEAVRTALKDARQTFGFASSTRTDSQLMLTVRATNEGLGQGY